MGFGGDIKYNPVAALVWVNKNYWEQGRIAARVYSGVLAIEHKAYVQSTTQPYIHMSLHLSFWSVWDE